MFLLLCFFFVSDAVPCGSIYLIVSYEPGPINRAHLSSSPLLVFLLCSIVLTGRGRPVSVRILPHPHDADGAFAVIRFILHSCGKHVSECSFAVERSSHLELDTYFVYLLGQSE